MKWCKVLKECRKKSNLTQKEVATKLNLSQNAISQYESGKRTIDSVTLKLFIDFFELEIGINPSKLKLKHTHILNHWNNKWQTLLKNNREQLNYFFNSEREFIKGIIFTDAHWYDEEDEEEGYRVSIFLKPKNIAFRKMMYTCLFLNILLFLVMFFQINIFLILKHYGMNSILKANYISCIKISPKFMK